MTTVQRLTAADVAAHFQKPVQWVLKVRREGHLTGINVGTPRRPEWRFTPESITEFEQARTDRRVA